MSDESLPDVEQLGNRVGKYQLRGEIGQGRMGTVYVAYDPTLDRKVAVKVLAPHLVCEPPFVDGFRRELRSAAKLDHPNIVTLHDAGRKEGRCYYVMNYIEGQPLDEVIRERAPLQAEETLAILRPLAEALDYAHSQGMVHGDMKPANVIVGPEGRVTLTDFAISRAVEGTWLTRWGVVVGSPEYMSPEQAMDKAINARSDQYSLGVLGYEMLTGRAPFAAEGNVQLVHQVVYQEPPSLIEARPDVPEASVEAINRALAKDAADRFATCAEFVDAFSAGMGAIAERDVVYVPAPAIRQPEPMPGAEAQAVATAEEQEPSVIPAAAAAAIAAAVVSRAADEQDVAAGPEIPAATETGDDWQEEETELVAAAKAAVEPAAAPETRSVLQPVPGPRSEDEGSGLGVPSVKDEDAKKRRRLPGCARALIGIAIVVILLGVAAYFAYLNGLLPPFLEPYARMILPPTTMSYEEYVGGGAADEAATPTPEPTPTPTPTPIPNPTMPAEALVPPDDSSVGDVWVRPIDAMAMLFVPAGEFMMGSEFGASDEQPEHAVALSDYWIDETEVTNTQYRWCVESGGCRAPTTCDFGAAPFEDLMRADHPVVCVDWEGARAYCAWVGGRLPTEAEWEYASRGPESSSYPWGDLEPTCALARYASCEDGTVEAGEMMDGASWVGALDMAGNAWEWVADWYDRKYYSQAPGQDPTGPESGSDRVLRGGGWYFDNRYMRSAGRYKLPPGQRLDYVGFRCVYVP